MKNNIQKVPYSKTCEGLLDWWTWEEICDKCGVTIFRFGDRLSTEQPDTTSKDLCLDCLLDIFKL